MIERDRPTLCRRDCRCDWCVRTALHVVKRPRKHDPAKQTRSARSARAAAATADLARAMRAGPDMPKAV